jgi:methylated-DNA-[protein]-cysteine S-methyltransferase
VKAAIPVDGRPVFRHRVVAAVRTIPAGRVATYGDVAAAAGRPRAARAVGNLMRTLKIPGLPYHRVVAAGGNIGGYGAYPQLKAALLAAEGLTVVRGRIRQFAERRIRPSLRLRRKNRAGNAPH